MFRFLSLPEGCRSHSSFGPISIQYLLRLVHPWYQNSYHAHPSFFLFILRLCQLSKFALPLHTTASNQSHPTLISGPFYLSTHGSPCRRVQVFNNTAICNNFNESTCSFPFCNCLHILGCARKHIPSQSVHAVHPRAILDPGPDFPFPGNRNYDPGIDLSTRAPSGSFLCQVPTQRVVSGFLYQHFLPTFTLFCPNLQSALCEPEVVSRLLQRKVSQRYIIGPCKSSPFFLFHVRRGRTCDGHRYACNARCMFFLRLHCYTQV